ncbi:acyl-CoA thioesterase [Mycolicibacterium thermoresistibile]|jgi:acyl-CoA thioesterase|uniref:Acyl-CoA thioesterase n=1 Tax=Mycolicibacterium thermoresistibile (strain ATCC 19527 / DSM 44167 / CIP 105390 / JCM 6362 / NCTC 10409 / 316) TaxID=1078020 RepID=G7CKP2_MYCT3|nr:acyl-CoA thioesterase domain-containing protein [Mycolicibacterium thermoresistibile]EHI12949.1 acyl-CoA thioesterase [Mycolicibacterium thermoresistibile ATCC 19527]MCV7188088.1 thioesterase family protein [Mycolicibacterium thermoresistibile]SNW17818.1 acyl-CoA thioesterase [Mycolicibacterium thermoresistibile]
MSVLLKLLDVAAGDGADQWIGAASGPAGKRAYGGQLVAQSLAAAARTVPAERPPTSLHLQFLRGGDAGAPVEYTVTGLLDGRTTAARRVDARQDGRLLTTATVSFAVPLSGPRHGWRTELPGDPEQLPRTGPAGPAPSMPLDELDIRIADEGGGAGFVRRFWWRATVALPDDPLVHTLVAAYVTDVYLIDPALQVHGFSMRARTHRSGTTDSSLWFHRRIRADEWNLLECTSPAAGRGRAVVNASLIRADGVIAATLAQEGLIADRGQPPR